MAQGRSTKIITMIKWIRTIRLSIKNSLSETQCELAAERRSAAKRRAGTTGTGGGAKSGGKRGKGKGKAGGMGLTVPGSPVELEDSDEE